MNLMWIGGDHPRHLYYANTIHASYPMAAAIVERRGSMIPQPPANLSGRDRENFDRHFENRDAAEISYFGTQALPDIPILVTSKEDLNSDRSTAFVKEHELDIVLIFGCGLIMGELYNALPHNTINLHLGLSPRYRGAATLFWPFYFMEPAYAGTTFHYIVSEPDAGDVVHQVVPDLDPEDGIHDVACKAVIQSTKEGIDLIKILASGGEWKRHKQKGTGKNFLSSDFKPEQLRVIYEVFNDDMVKQYLEGKLPSRQPKLIRQW